MEAATKIDIYLDGLPAWQTHNLAAFRKAVHQVVPEIIEDWKWNVPVFLLGGKVFLAMSAFKAHTKFNFLRNGALLADADKLFNNGFGSKQSRGIDYREGETFDQAKLIALLTESYQLTKPPK